MPKEATTDDTEFSPEEAAKRRDAALRRALNMPHKPHVAAKRKKRRKPSAKR